ncbi:histidine/lysine/arginine/ornithine ABC transporter ATP-binding protein [Ochrobactrum sp. MYb15]|uniref:ABC transporter ATP-binding protein n=1 Tax=Brucella pituitosa TaxID=571256 RepID=UPI000CFC7053|nr:histidine/lysine/arginine/ornithine ABC transporter ATP-binding protein [Ochrobactrum sp. MYb19]PRA60584.1 histidine/lysine/arginine/ornithine ABC transporter ATP-binding protein [Ochrobactrum sp. MYb18]PRA73461.1 histidine/lysine/arginine/ornithine ABC transporter ATP-binding protein [Brucella thiophenivorans]PRA85428.1 histidine/lysine/arginine/ornithine ABC transporter ATP-binding protein [Ochrobactrum sp. MYb14]PRA94984.1 histidine/lysine/arginine/ornithine ABC transporter ATP-binding pr
MTIEQIGGPAVALRVENIHKSFGTLEVLKGISLTAKDHDVISIIGSSGSGKSTFLRCINLLESPSSGSIYVKNERLELRPDSNGGLCAANARQLARLRSKLAMVFQNFNLWPHLTVLENVIEAPISVLGLSRKEAVERADENLAKVGLYDRRSYYPSHLSGGQQQRAAIARGLAMDPDVLLFDEPTSALDPELVGEVLKVMRAIADEGRTMLVVTHEIAFARDVSTEVIYLRNGQLEEKGTPEEVLLNPRSEHLQKFLARTRA